MRAELLEFLRETPLLDYSAKPIEKLIENRGWKMLDEFHRIQKIYDFVRNEILFGYNVRDDLPGVPRALGRVRPMQYKGHPVYGSCCAPTGFPAVCTGLPSTRNCRRAP